MKDKEVNRNTNTSAAEVKAPDAEFLIDRANGPRTLPFPAWSDVARWHEDLGAYTYGARYWPRARLVRLYLAPGNCCDMEGAIYAALHAGREVARIEVFSGSDVSTAYVREYEISPGQDMAAFCQREPANESSAWRAEIAQGWRPGTDYEGEEHLLPPTHEEQAPATGYATMPFSARPGTTAAAHLEGIRLEMEAELERQVRALRSAAAEEFETYAREVRGEK